MNYKELKRVIPGEPGTFLDADKANETIDAINAIIRYINDSEGVWSGNSNSNGSNTNTVNVTYCEAGVAVTHTFVIVD